MVEGVESAQLEWAGMTVASTAFAAGTDGTDMLRQMCGEGLCPVPHWGYVVSGSIGARYSDGHEEVAQAGEVFYLPPGHAPFTTEPAEVIEFSPAHAVAEMMERVAAFVAAQASS
jgi:hypothetical protein